MEAAARFCPACGHPNPSANRFCGGCGSPLSAGAAPSAPAVTAIPEKERRLVTVLFSDLVGSTSLGEQLDPEVVEELITSAQAALRLAVEEYGGNVAKFLGDGLMALFGAPIAHEDDAERAVLAGLRMHTVLAGTNERRPPNTPALQLRVGITTGDVVAGAASGTYDVIGDAANVAARLQGAAAVGGVLVGEETMRLARRRIRFGERQELALKGKAEPVSAYAVLGVREQLGERWEGAEATSRGSPREYPTPLVGRDRELEMLLARWERARAGTGQLISLVAEPGVGKSRLIAETLEWIAATPDARIVRGRCLSYGQSISLWLIADLLRYLCSPGEEAGPEAVRASIVATLDDVMGGCDAEDRAIARDVMGEVLGLPPADSLVARASPQVRRQSLIRSLRLLLGSLSTREPTVLILEDLHWIDTASQDILTEILSEVPGMRLLVLVAQRPEGDRPWSGWDWPEHLVLEPLEASDAEILAEAVLGGMPLSEDLVTYVGERAGGNPFYVEELLRFLRESGGLEEREGRMYLVAQAAEQLPSTLTEVLLARLDRLEQQVKGVALIGSIIGRSFAVRLLARVMDQEEAALELSLHALQQAEITVPGPGIESEHVFKHVLLRDAAYSMIVQRRKRQLHLTAARAIAQLYPSDEYIEMIAYHYARTEEHGEAATWLEKAGDRAAGVYANETAIESYREARRQLELSGVEAPHPTRLDEKLGNVLATATRFDEALEALGRAAEVYRQERDLDGVARVMARIGWTHRYRGTPDEGIAAIQPVLDVISWSGPSQGLATLHLALSFLHHGSGRYQESLEAAERAAELARALGDERILGGAEMRRGTALARLGQLDKGTRVLEGSLPLLESAGDLETLAIAYNNLAVNYDEGGDLKGAWEWGTRGLETYERIGSTASIGYALISMATILVFLGKWDEAEGYIERGAALITAMGAYHSAPYAPMERGHLRLRQGRWEEAARELEEAINLAGPIGHLQGLEEGNALLGELEVLDGRAEAARDRVQALVAEDGPFVVSLLTTLAWASCELDDLDRADEAVRRGLAIAKERYQRLYMPDLLRVQGMVLARQERWDEAEKTLAEALSLARSMPYPYGEGRTLFEDGMMHVQKGEYTQAGERLEEGLAIFRRLGAAKDVERTERVLADLDRSTSPAR